MCVIRMQFNIIIIILYLYRFHSYMYKPRGIDVCVRIIVFVDFFCSLLMRLVAENETTIRIHRSRLQFCRTPRFNRNPFLIRWRAIWCDLYNMAATHTLQRLSRAAVEGKPTRHFAFKAYRYWQSFLFSYTYNDCAGLFFLLQQNVLFQPTRVLFARNSNKNVI